MDEKIIMEEMEVRNQARIYTCTVRIYKVGLRIHTSKIKNYELFNKMYSIVYEFNSTFFHIDAGWSIKCTACLMGS